MTTEESVPYSAGAHVSHGDGMVKLRIVALNSEGIVTHVLAGIALPPEVARNVAYNLTTESFKAEDSD